MPPPVTRDLTDPAFPHGKSAGYLRGCTAKKPCPSTPTCTEARRRAVNARALAHLNGKPPRVPLEPVLRHIEWLVEQVPGATGTHIGEIAGLHHSAWTTMRRSRTCTRRTAAAILAVTPDMVRKTTHVVPIEKVRHLAYTMQALGYPLVWQAEQCGEPQLPQKINQKHRDCQFVERVAYERVQALADRVADQPADPIRDGISPIRSSLARTFARKAGYWPPAAYDSDGNLDLRLLPGHPWAEAIEHASRAVEAIRLVLHGGMRLHEAEAHTGFDGDVLRRYRQRAGLVYQRGAHQSAPSTLDREASADAIARIDQVLARYNRGEIDPLYALLELGVLPARGTPLVPADHPTLVQWLTDHPKPGRQAA